MFQIRRRNSGNLLNAPCVSIHPEGKLKQKVTVMLRSGCQLLEQAKQRTTNAQGYKRKHLMGDGQLFSRW